MRGSACCLAAAVLVAGPAVARGADARAGEALYVGAARLANGGAPCLACHGLEGHGLAWRASFGPDLTDVGASYDADTIAGLLEDVPFPSMAPIYATHRLTAAERADLAAFLVATRAAAAAAVATGDPRGRLLLEAGAGALVLLAILLVLARRRMPPVAVALRASRHELRGQP